MSVPKERPPLEEMTLRQLRRVASELGISRYSRMRKDQLLASIQAKATSPISSPSPIAPPAIAPVTPVRTIEAQEAVEAAKFDLGQPSNLADLTEDLTLDPETLSGVDEGLPDLPGGYGESRIVMLPRDPQWAYAYWDVPAEHKDELRAQGGLQLALRVYDVTDVDLSVQRAHTVQEFPCDELAREWYLPIPISDRDYAIEIGYRCADGRWLVLARSAPVRIPPVYPSDWIEDIFVTVDWEQDLRGATVATLVPPAQKAAMAANNTIYQQVFGMAAGVEAMRVAGSLFGSMQHVPGSVSGSIQHMGEQAISSYLFPSGVGMWAAGAAAAPGALSASGMGMSGVGMMMSGIGFGASMPPIRPRQFWLVADAELIVYGATEPDATVTIGGQPIKLNPDGTFRFQMSFQDGMIDYPIMAVASDGEQMRSIHMKFERETPSRNTNTKEEATLEWLS
jgi:hypothetical protein